MRLATNIDLYAGGPGSGCHGNNCGRPPGLHGEIEPGDTARLLVAHKVFNSKNLQYQTAPIGTVVKVISVLPKVPGQEQMVNVSYPGRKEGLEKVPLKDLFVVKKGKENLAKIVPKPVGQSKTKLKYKTKDGAQVTVIKPSTHKDDKQARVGPHGLKGKFKEVTGSVKVYGDPNQHSRVFFAKYGNAPDTERTAGQVVRNPEAFQGTTVHVMTRPETVFGPRPKGESQLGPMTKGMHVREYNAGAYGHQFGNMRDYRYKNIGAGRTFLNKRYGIKYKLDKL